MMEALEGRVLALKGCLSERVLSLSEQEVGWGREYCGGISVEEVVEYARRVGRCTAAPPYWRPGMPMVGFLPPAPTPEAMRVGTLTRLSRGGEEGELGGLEHPGGEEPGVEEDEEKGGGAAGDPGMNGIGKVHGSSSNFSKIEEVEKEGQQQKPPSQPQQQQQQQQQQIGRGGVKRGLQPDDAATPVKKKVKAIFDLDDLSSSDEDE